LSKIKYCIFASKVYFSTLRVPENIFLKKCCVWMYVQEVWLEYLWTNCQIILPELVQNFSLRWWHFWSVEKNCRIRKSEVTYEEMCHVWILF
jgi:hypothetical protein